ncbi:hypothetical protein H6G17_28470 [Chroococcidiopsis sp. FACHB-1243]|uniref:hypothetical protein n=1 Tax=Chroococcidiopsis sp. [FACHB-1243] TaxID=2692781 RepID=UPI00177AE42B|nr:hypothetical protein [Chroococcidiopsis sp. [FACHB-1243]]MBD2309392.1 hypothetical protein [Chroococcidiopsis sp. [FACHB-1243]]
MEIASINSQRVTGGNEFGEREFCGSGFCNGFFKRDCLLGSQSVIALLGRVLVLRASMG